MWGLECTYKITKVKHLIAFLNLIIGKFKRIKNIDYMEYSKNRSTITVAIIYFNNKYILH